MSAESRGVPAVRRAEQLAGRPGLESLRVLSGTPGLHPVVSVRLVDLADDRVAAGELLVCVAGDLTSWRLDALIRRAAAAEAAGIVLPGTTPPPTAASSTLATRLRLPLLVVPKDELLDVVTRTLTLVRASEVDRADRLLRCAHRWRDGDRGPERVLSDLERELGARARLGDREQAGAWAPELRNDLPLAQTFTTAANEMVIAHPITAPSRQWLILRFEDAPSGLLDNASALARLAVVYLRGWFLARRWELEQDRGQRARLLARLVAEKEQVTDSTRRWAAEMGWRLDGWHIGLHLRVSGPVAEGKRDRVATELRNAGDASVVVERGAGWEGWLTSDAAPEPDALHRLLTRLRTCVDLLGEDQPLRIGVGSARAGPAGLVRSLGEAREVVSGIDTRTGGVASTDALGIHRLVGGLLGSPTARAFAESALAPLAENTALLDTLAVYLDCGSSVTSTAHRLGVHRNTVNARLGRIERALAVDLSDPDVRLAFQLACRALNTKD